MKRLIILFISVMVALVLTACGGDESDAKTETQPTEKAEKVEKKNDSKDVSSEVVESETSKIKILGSEIVPHKYEEGVDMLVVEVEFTNKKDEPSGITDDFSTIEAVQETESSVDRLNNNSLAGLPDDYKPELKEMSETGVKSGATVKSLIAFDIKHPGESVKLINYDGLETGLTFERVIETE